MDTVSEQAKISSRWDTPFVAVPFPVGVDEISVSNARTASSCVHYKVFPDSNLFKRNRCEGNEN